MTPNDIQREYHAACEAFIAAGDVMPERDMTRYEAKLRHAGIGACNAIEYGLKRYLETHAISSVQQEYRNRESKTLGSCTYIVRERSLLDAALRDQLRDIVNRRNDVVHGAYPLGAESVRDAIGIAFDLMTKFLGMHPQPVPAMPRAGATGEDPSELREQYLELVRKRWEFVDLRGLCLTTETTRIEKRLSDFFVPPTLREKGGGSRFGKSEEPIDVTVDQAMESPAIVLLGDPGMGKSTTLRKIALDYASSQSGDQASAARLPLLVGARRIADKLRITGGTDLVRALADIEGESLHEGESFHDLLKGALQRGECIVMVDALDEVGGASERRDVADAVTALFRLYPGNQFIVTTRVVGFNPNNLSDFKRFEVQPLSPDSRLHLLAQWFEGDASKAIVLANAIQQNSAACKLAEQPLLLTIMAIEYPDGTSLPESRSELYARFVDTMSERWPRTKGKITYRPDEVREAMTSAAFRMFKDGTADIREPALREVFSDFLEMRPVPAGRQRDDEVAEMLRVVEDVTGLLVWRGTERGAKLYAFAHTTLGEYLAACRLAERAKWQDWGLHGVTPDARSVHTFALMTEIVAPPTPEDEEGLYKCIEAVASTDGDNPLPGLLFAWDVARDSKCASEGMTGSLVNRLLVTAIPTTSVEEWTAAYSRLADAGWGLKSASLDESEPPAVCVRRALLALIASPGYGPNFDALFSALAKSGHGRKFFDATVDMDKGPFRKSRRGGVTEGFIATTGGPADLWGLEDMDFDHSAGPCWSFTTLDIAGLAGLGFQLSEDEFQVTFIDDGGFYGLPPTAIAGSIAKTSTFWRELRDIRRGYPDAPAESKAVLAHARSDASLKERFLCWQAAALGEEDRGFRWSYDWTAETGGVLELQSLVERGLEGTPNDWDYVLECMAPWGIEEAHWLTDDAVDSLRILLNDDSPRVRHAAARVLAQTGRYDVEDVPAILQVWPDAYGVEPCHEGNLWTAEAFIRLTERDAKPAVAAQLSNLFGQSGFVRKMALQYNKTFTALSAIFVTGRVYRETGDATLEVSPCPEYADALAPLLPHEDPIVRYAALTLALLWLPTSEACASTRRMWESARDDAACALNPESRILTPES